MIAIVKYKEDVEIVYDFHTMVWNEVGGYMNIFSKSERDDVPIIHSFYNFKTIEIIK